MRLIALFLLFITQQSFAQKPDWISINQLIDDSEARNETTLMISAINRCAALHLNISNAIGGDNPSLRDMYDASALQLVDLSINASLLLREKRTGNTSTVDFEEIEQDTLVILQTMTNNYSNWMSYNFINTGENVGNDSDLIDDINACTRLPDMINESGSDSFLFNIL